MKKKKTLNIDSEVEFLSEDELAENPQMEFGAGFDGAFVEPLDFSEGDQFPDDSHLGRVPIVIVPESCGFPHMPVSLPITLEENEPIVSEAIETGEPVGLFFVDMSKYERGKSKGISRIGVLAHIVKRVIERDDAENKSQMLCVCGPRVSVEKFNVGKGKRSATLRRAPILENLSHMEIAAHLHLIADKYDAMLDMEHSSMQRASDLMTKMPPELFVATITFQLPVSGMVKNEILSRRTFSLMTECLLKHLDVMLQLMKIKTDITARTDHELNRQERENYIMHQINMLQREINHGNTDADRLRTRAESKKWDEATDEHFKRELAKLERFSPNTPDYSIQYTYLDTFLNLPWQSYSESKFNFDQVEATLNRDHFGLDRVKERILEHMAVAKLRDDNKAPIICLVGPPGVGKTSLGRSIAEAIGRDYVRVSFGGMHDEAEIRGHRRTYLGSMPGRIISSLARKKWSNPVMVLDEIDKIGKDFKGDPSTALLEVLDPEQNSHFHDNYLDTDYDLSNIMFIATANSLETISAPLLDRMEIISIPGYITAEKVEIARRHLVPKVLKATGFGQEEISFTEDALQFIIDYYTRESGVRKLEKTIAKVLRKLAVKKVRGMEYPTVIDRETANELLGKVEYNPDMYENNDFTGVVTGLAWTQVGGEILFIESSVTEGKGKLTLTGNLGDVMKESAAIALQYLRAHASLLGMQPSDFDSRDYHIHVPEGAIPKDGPSAGITMATSLASALTGKKVKSKLAMTGEITLRGKVLPVGGIKEKIIAAKRAGINQIILSRENEKDIAEINERYVEGMTFTYVRNIEEVLSEALLPG